ncbi:hypothetical protein L1887_07447 [Cichorium endivia]|nr:hypothetical protein L1887_07447 [Cichorium endivia]
MHYQTTRAGMAVLEKHQIHTCSLVHFEVSIYHRCFFILINQLQIQQIVALTNEGQQLYRNNKFTGAF